MEMRQEKNGKSSKKRICFFSGDITRSGGTERVSIQLANGMVERNEFKEYEICFLSIVEQGAEPFFPIDKRIIRYTLGERWITPGVGYIPLIMKVNRFLKKRKTDVIIDIDIVLDVLSIPASVGLKTKVIAWEHFNCEFEQGIFYRRCISKMTARFADYIVTLTNEDQKNYEKILGRKRNIKAIYNMILKLEVNENVSREQWIVSVGRLTYQKGIDYLIEVARRVLPQNPEWKWLILGEGEDRIKLENAIKTYGLENQLILKGNVRNVDWYLNRARLLVMTSRYEGFGMCLVEALQMHVPCVSFDVKIGPSEIIADKKNGILVSPFNCADMAEEIDELLKDPERLQGMAENTLIDFERFQDESILQNWKKVLTKVYTKNVKKSKKSS